MDFLLDNHDDERKDERALKNKASFVFVITTENYLHIISNYLIRTLKIFPSGPINFG
jgi:hypothetical protein